MEGANAVDIASFSPMKSHLLLIQSLSQKEEWHEDVQFVYSCENSLESDSIFSNVSHFFQNKILVTGRENSVDIWIEDVHRKAK